MVQRSILSTSTRPLPLYLTIIVRDMFDCSFSHSYIGIYRLVFSMHNIMIIVGCWSCVCKILFWFYALLHTNSAVGQR